MAAVGMHVGLARWAASADLGRDVSMTVPAPVPVHVPAPVPVHVPATVPVHVPVHVPAQAAWPARAAWPVAAWPVAAWPVAAWPVAAWPARAAQATGLVDADGDVIMSEPPVARHVTWGPVVFA